MCDRSVLVPIPAFLYGDIYDFDPSHPEYGIDEDGNRCLGLDECIVPAVKALWAAGIRTKGCCCGHGSGNGVISIVTSTSPEFMALARQRIVDGKERTLAPVPALRWKGEAQIIHGHDPGIVHPWSAEAAGADDGEERT